MKFKEMRLAANLTQKQAAELIGVRQSAISMWETGLYYPRMGLLPDIAKAYGCSVNDLFN